MNEYGRDIYNQLMMRPMDVGCWGASAFKVFSSEYFNKDQAHRGGLLFKVRGLLHKGHVMIRVDGTDTYIVEIGTLSKGEFKSKKKLTGIYVDMLHQVIDDMVEGTLNKSNEVVKKAYANTKFF